MLLRGVAPGPSKLEILADEIRDPKFQNWYATVRTEQEKAAVRTALDAYSRTYGSAVWARYAAAELDGEGRPRVVDLAELALTIESGEDRREFAKAHSAAYDLIVKSGSSAFAASYVEHLASLHKAGGRDWRVVRNSPLAAAVHAATTTSGKTDLWTWYLDNRDWCDDYLCAFQIDPGADDPGDAVVAALEEFARRPKLYRALRDEVRESADENGDASSALDLEAGEFLALAMGTVSLYGDTFEVLCDADVPFGESLDVLANNIEDLDFTTPDACRETGVKLENLYRSNRGVWDAAAAPGGGGAIRFFRNVPAHAETVLTRFGEAGVLPFLMANYDDSTELLTVAAESIKRYESVGWAVLETFAGNDEFKRALLNKDVGHLVVPYVALKGGESSAVAQCVDDPRWVKRYLNTDGSFKPETETIIEAMPLVGGIATVVKHQFRGEPVTMEEIGWAAFDVVDDVVTAAAIIGAVAATPATGGGSDAAAAALIAAKEAAVESAKSGVKITVRQGAKQLAKQSGKAGGRYVARQGSKMIVRNGVETAVGRESKALVRRSLFGRVARTAARAGSWTVRTAGKTVRLVSSPISKSAAAWRKLPPAVRTHVLKTAAAAMFFIAVTARTIPKLPEALHETLTRAGEQIGTLVNKTVKGMADGIKAAILATIGFKPSAFERPANFTIGAAALGLALLLLLRRRKAGASPPARLA